MLLSNFFLLSSNADRAPQLKAGVRHQSAQGEYGEAMKLMKRFLICLFILVSCSSAGRAIEYTVGSSPSPPSCITLGSSLKRLTLFFCESPERDVAGYNVYRSTDSRLPKDQWLKLNRSLLKRTTYVDEAVESGKEYFYYLTAQDGDGNSSKPSVVLSAEVH